MLKLFTSSLKRELEMISTHDKKEQSYQLRKIRIYKRRPSLLSGSLSIFCRNVSQAVLFPKDPLPGHFQLPPFYRYPIKSWLDHTKQEVEGFFYFFKFVLSLTTLKKALVPLQFNVLGQNCQHGLVKSWPKQTVLIFILTGNLV